MSKEKEDVSQREERLSGVLDRHRGANSLTLPDVIRSATADGLELSESDLWWVSSNLPPRDGGYHYDGLCPTIVSDFVARLLAESSAQTVLDPWVGYGTLLRPVLREVNAAVFVGVTPHAGMLKITEAYLADHQGDVRVGDSDLSALKDDEVFDLVVSAPPFGEIREFTVGNMDFRDETVGEILLRSVLRMKPSGVGYFLVSLSFLLSIRKNTVVHELSHFGVYVDACFSLRGINYGSSLKEFEGEEFEGDYRDEHFDPHSLSEHFYPGGGESYVIVVRRGETPESMFVAAVPDSAEAQDAVIANYRERSSGSDPERGVWVDRREFNGLRPLVLTKNLERKVKRLDLPTRALHELCTVIARCPKERDDIPDVENSFFFKLYKPWNCELHAEDCLSRFGNNSLTDWVHVQVDPELADARVVVKFLRSPLGRQAFEAHVGSGIIDGFHLPRGRDEDTRIQVSAVRDLLVWLPDLEQQRLIISIDQKLDSISVEIEGIKTSLWGRLDTVHEAEKALGKVNREDTFPGWLDTLPYPLASILWTYHTAKKEPWRAYTQLDFFFEGLSQFLAVLAMSALRQDGDLFHKIWPGVRSTLNEAKMTLDRPTVGTWVCVFEVLAKRIRKDLDNRDGARQWQDLFACDDLDLLKAIVDKGMVSILKKANTMRNGWRGHGGIVSDVDARRRESSYLDLLRDFRELVEERWSSYPLVLPKDGRYSGGLHIYKVARVMGTRTPFEVLEMEVRGPMEDAHLHMVAPEARTPCPLLPFVHVGASPSDALNTCYFYSRVATKGLKYVSYHFEEIPEVIEPFARTQVALAEFSVAGTSP